MKALRSVAVGLVVGRPAGRRGVGVHALLSRVLAVVVATVHVGVGGEAGAFREHVVGAIVRAASGAELGVLSRPGAGEVREIAALLVPEWLLIVVRRVDHVPSVININLPSAVG